MKDHNYYVYILVKERNSTFYVGVTSDLIKRIGEHKNDINCEFTAKYGVKRLVYYEWHTDIKEAIKREKRLKKWNRIWKMRLIEEKNPEWEDLYEALF